MKKKNIKIKLLDFSLIIHREKAFEKIKNYIEKNIEDIKNRHNNRKFVIIEKALDDFFKYRGFMFDRSELAYYDINNKKLTEYRDKWRLFYGEMLLDDFIYFIMEHPKQYMFFLIDAILEIEDVVLV